MPNHGRGEGPGHATAEDKRHHRELPAAWQSADVLDPGEGAFGDRGTDAGSAPGLHSC